MATYSTGDPGGALQQHLRAFFAGHTLARRTWPYEPLQAQVPDFGVYEISPGPRFAGWTYVTDGCWRLAPERGDPLEFSLSANAPSLRHVEILTMNAHYHAGPPVGRLDHAHTVPLGQPWTAGSECEYLLVSLPYAYGPEFELCEWTGGRLRLLSLIPITAAERKLKVDKGLETLEQSLEDAAADFTNPARPSAV